MADLQLIFDFLMNILTTLANLMLNHFIMTVSLSLVLLKLLADVMHTIRIKFF